MSGNPCGCDPDAKPPHKCADHKIPTGMLTLGEAKLAFMEWRAHMAQGGFAHAEQVKFFTILEAICEEDR